MGQTQISLGTMGGAPYRPPLQVVASGVVTMGAGLSPSPAPLTLQLAQAGRAAELVDLWCDTTAGVTVQINADNQPQINQTVAQLETFPTTPNRFSAKAYRNLSLNFVNTGSSAVTNFRYFFTLRFWTPTVIEKITRGLTLNAADQRVATDPYGLAPLYVAEKLQPPPTLYDLIAQGQQPLSWSDLTTMDYDAKPTLTASVGLNDQPAETSVTFQDLVPVGGNKFIVLESLAGDPDTVADNVEIVLAVDGQEAYLTVPTYPLDSSDAPVWIAAQQEIRADLEATAGVPAAAINTRLNYSLRPLSPLLLCRWGATTINDLATSFAGMNVTDPGNAALQLWNQVAAGLK